MNIKCFMCWEKLEEPGALYFHIPFKDDTTSYEGRMVTEKIHLCQDCSYVVRAFMLHKRKEER